MKLNLSTDNLSTICWWVNASHAIHKDCLGHTGAMMSLGKGATVSFSDKQKIKTKSSTESELVGADQALSSILHTRYFIEAQGCSVKQNILFQDNESQCILKSTDHSPAPNAPNTSNVATSSFTIKLLMVISRYYTALLKLCGPMFSLKPKHGGPFHLDRSNLMNVPINSDEDAEQLKTNPLLLPSDERPLCPYQMNDQLPKTPIIHSRSV
jgi:hypothetical protein